MKINKYSLTFTIFSIILITFIIYNTLCSKKNIEPYSNISSTPTLLTDDKYYTSTPDLWDKNKTKPLIGGQKFYNVNITIKDGDALVDSVESPGSSIAGAHAGAGAGADTGPGAHAGAGAGADTGPGVDTGPGADTGSIKPMDFGNFSNLVKCKNLEGATVCEGEACKNYVPTEVITCKSQSDESTTSSNQYDCDRNDKGDCINKYEIARKEAERLAEIERKIKQEAEILAQKEKAAKNEAERLAAKKEKEQKEAEAREAEKKRKAAEEAAAKQKAEEAARVEAARVEAARVEAARVEAARVEQQRLAELKEKKCLRKVTAKRIHSQHDSWGMDLKFYCDGDPVHIGNNNKNETNKTSYGNIKDSCPLEVNKSNWDKDQADHHKDVGDRFDITVGDCENVSEWKDCSWENEKCKNDTPIDQLIKYGTTNKKGKKCTGAMEENGIECYNYYKIIPGQEWTCNNSKGDPVRGIKKQCWISQ